MNDWKPHRRAIAMYDALLPLASTCAAVKPHWVRTPKEDLGDYCRGCGRAVTRHLRRRERNRSLRSEYILDGGWRTESDGPRYCEGCGVKLDFALTDYGVTSELEHFAHYGVRPGSTDDARCLLEVLTQLQHAKADQLALADVAADCAEALLWSCQ